MRLKSTLAWIALDLTLLSVAAWSVAAALSSPAFPEAEDHPAPASPSSSLGISTQAGEGMLNTPLFTPSRQQYIAPEQAPILAPQPVSPRLVGIVQDSPKVRRALLETPAGETRRLLGQGEAFQEWVVTKVGPDAVELILADSATRPVPPQPLSLRLHPAERAWTATNE